MSGGNLAQITQRGQRHTGRGTGSQRGSVSHCHTVPLSSHSARQLPLSSNTRQVRVPSSSMVPPNSRDPSTDPQVGKGGNGRTDCEQQLHICTFLPLEKDSDPAFLQLDLLSSEGRLPTTHLWCPPIKLFLTFAFI